MPRGGGASASSARVAKSNTGSHRATQTPGSGQRQSSGAVGIAGGSVTAKSADATPLQPSGEMQGPSDRDGTDAEHPAVVQHPSFAAEAFSTRAWQHGGNSADPTASR